MAHESRKERPAHDADLAPELAAVEAALTGLAPRPARLSAARLMYLAGQESAASSRRGIAAWLWPSLATVSTLAASILAVCLAMQAEPRVVYVERSGADAPLSEGVAVAPLPTDEVAAPEDPLTYPPVKQIPPPYYLRARELAMSQGVDALPALPPGAGTTEIHAATYRDLQNRAFEGENGGRRKPADGGFYTWPNLMLPSWR